MNMSISTTPVSSGSASAATSGSGSASGAGFAGALVQAIGGGSNSTTAVGGLSLPVGLAGILGQVDPLSSEDQSQDLLELIAKLIEQLEQLEQGDGIQKEAEDQLSALLTAIQGLVQQLGQSQPDLTGYPMNASNVSLLSQLTETSNSKPVLQALRETLQQLSTLLAKGKGGVHAAAAFAGQLKALLDTLEPLKASVPASGQAVTDQADKAASGSKAAPDNGVAVSKEALNQAAAVVQDIRRPVQVLRDPIWRFNIDANMVNTASDGQTAVVPAAIASEESNDSNSHTAWTLLRNDASAAAESTLGKLALPAQVPVQQFAQQIEKFLIKQFLLTQGNGTTEAKLTLNPEHLGQVDIRIIMQNGQITAQFMTDNPMARDLLDNQMSQLRLALHGQGLQVDRLEVVQQSSASSNASFLHQDHRHPNSRNNGNGSNGQGKNGLYEDPALFAAELERNSTLREFGYGSSLNVTA
ncbi:flagellar hook-length control protein FliK [Cohnella sp.]|uniref:flagellar hook-length control protein FliK n=1 Tax=Cohnella sp. TaxID=1883426 RepID=UPI0035671B7F